MSKSDCYSHQIMISGTSVNPNPEDRVQSYVLVSEPGFAVLNEDVVKHTTIAPLAHFCASLPVEDGRAVSLNAMDIGMLHVCVLNPRSPFPGFRLKA